MQSESSHTLSHPSSARTGQVLDDRYELGDVLGSGGMATVYRAHDRRLGRAVAVKVLHAHYAGDASFVQRFRREAEFAAGLGAHRHIVDIYDVGSDGDVHYIVMKLVEGCTLKDLIRREGPLPERQAREIGSQVAAALAFAHQRGLVHRDIKPQNVLVAPDGHVEVTDFGIAHRGEATQITSPDMMLGTAQYVSPEQAQGQTPGPASDIYSLGVVLFEMMTGRLPFRGDTPLAVAVQHAQTPPPAPDTLNPALSPAGAAVILRALAKSPADRFRDAAELEGTLRGPQAGDSVPTAYRPLAGSTVPPSPPAPRPRAARSGVSPRWLLLPVLGALLALAAWLANGTRLDSHGAATATSFAPRSTSPPAFVPLPRPATATPTTIPSPTLPPPTATSQPAVVPAVATATPPATPTAPPPTPTSTSLPTATATSTAPPQPTLQPSGLPQPGGDAHPAGPPSPPGQTGPPGHVSPPPGPAPSPPGHDHHGPGGGDHGHGAGHGDHG